MIDMGPLPTTEEVREAAATDGYATHRISHEEFDAWLDEVKNDAYHMGRDWYEYDAI